MPDAGDIAHWLQRQLARREWSAADLSRQLGVGNSTVAMWLRRERVPNPQSVDRIADVLGADVDYLLTLAGHRPAAVEIDPDSATARLMPLIEQIDWESRPGRLEEMEAELRFMIEMDRKRKKAEVDRGGHHRKSRGEAERC